MKAKKSIIIAFCIFIITLNVNSQDGSTYLYMCFINQVASYEADEEISFEKLEKTDGVLICFRDSVHFSVKIANGKYWDEKLLVDKLETSIVDGIVYLDYYFSTRNNPYLFKLGTFNTKENDFSFIFDSPHHKYLFYGTLL